jgi:hypothetical protein
MQVSRRRILSAAKWLFVAASLGGQFAVAGERCKPIKFKSGGNSAVVQGIAPYLPPSATPAELEVSELCYEIATGSGQHASVRLLPGTGKNVVFGIDDVIDPGDDKNKGSENHSFLTEQRIYKIRVMQLMSRREAQPFKLSVVVK